MNETIKEKLKNYLNHDINIGYEFNHDLLIGLNPVYTLIQSEQEMEEIAILYTNAWLNSNHNQEKAGFENFLKGEASIFENSLKGEASMNISKILSATPIFLQEWKNEFEQLGIEYPKQIDELIEKAQQYQKQFELNKEDFNNYTIEDFASTDKKMGGLFSIRLEDNKFTINIDFFDELKSCIDDIHTHLNEYGVLKKSQAQQFVTAANALKTDNSTDQLTHFIINYDDIKNKETFGSKIEAELNLTKSQKITKAMFFSDDSVAIETNDGQLQTPDIGSGIYNFNDEIIKPIVANYMDYYFRKKPAFKNFFQPIVEQTSFSGKLFQQVMEAMELINECEPLLKKNTPELLQNIKFNNCENINKIMKEPFISKNENERNYQKLIEGVVDEVDAIKHRKEVEKYTNSILSKKYQFLLNEDNQQWFKELYENKIAKDNLKEFIGNKLASFKSPEMLTQALERFYNSINNFSMDSVLRRCDNLNVETVNKDDDDLLILKVNDYEASNILGSPSWCIATRKTYFENYTDGNKSQFFIYDFNKLSKDNTSMIGITLTENGDVSAMHYKDDSMVTDASVEKKWQSKINEALNNKSQNKPQNNKLKA